MNAPATQLFTETGEQADFAPSFERRRLRLYMLQMAIDMATIIGGFVLAGGLYLGKWPAPLALIEAQVLLPLFLTIAAASARRLFAEAFGEDAVEVRAHGNAFAATCLVQGVALEDVGADWIDHDDPCYPVVITVRARRADDGG